MSDKKSNNNHDYGYYGKGTSGYIHYKQDFDRNSSHSGGGEYGCLAWLGLLLILALAAGVFYLWLLMMYALGSILPK